MEQFIEKQFTPELMSQILTVFQLDSDYKKLGDFENYAFEVYQNGDPRILRVTHSSHRSQKELEAELDWIQYLHGCGIRIPAVWVSPNGHTVESFAAEQSYFFASLFEKAEGQPVKPDDDAFNEKLFRIWGKTIGKMHHFTKHYQPAAYIQPRYHWDENDLVEIEHFFPQEDHVAKQEAHKVIAQIKMLPKTKDTYGLLHTDAHLGNFFYDGESIHIFDFDDACYHFFATDIAIPLYYSVNSKHFTGTREERNAFAKCFIQAFLEGYREENELSQEWIETIPLFLKLRDIELYTVFAKKVPVEERNERVQHWMSEIKERMETSRAIVDLDVILQK